MTECELCGNYNYDSELDDWLCEAYMDEDDRARLSLDRYTHCPYWRSDDEYRTVKHQAVGHLPGYADEGRFAEPKQDRKYEGER